MKKNILIVFGGTSSEHEISCRSAGTIIRALDKDMYMPICLGITKEGRWYYTEPSPDDIENGEWAKGTNSKSAIISPDRECKGILIEGQKRIKIDCVFPIVHGKYGEDGTLQGLLEMAALPYVGSGVLASSAAMDKTVTKMFAKEVGIKQAKYYTLSRYDIIERPTKIMSEIEKYFNYEYPLFIKPANAGSSVGVTKAERTEELIEGIRIAAEEDHKIVIEEAIEGRELEVAVMGSRKPMVTGVGEILPAKDFYDYEAKYLITMDQTKIADDLDQSIIEELQEKSIKIHKALGCRGLSRVDFFLKKSTNEIIFNEINTLPGFTSISMYPKLWKQEGIEIEELVSKLIELAIEQ